MNIESINKKDSVCLIDIGHPIDSVIRQKIIDDSSLFGIHDKNAHLFESAQLCTDKNYFPPELSIEQIQNLTIGVTVFTLNNHYYAISADAVNIVSKGLTETDAINGLLCMVKMAIRCGYKGIYPVSSNRKFQKRYYETFLCGFIDYNMNVHYSNINNNYNTIILYDDESKKVARMIIDEETMSVILIRRMLKSLLENYNHSCISYKNYLHWKDNGCPVIKIGLLFGIVLFDGNINTSNIHMLIRRSVEEKKTINVVFGIVDKSTILTSIVDCNIRYHI